MFQSTPVPWTLLGLSDEFELEHLELRLLASTATQGASQGHDGGVVRNSATINFDTGESIEGGLFDEAIFGELQRDPNNVGGPRRELRREAQRRGRAAQLSFSEARRDRFGVIELAAPMLHPAFLIGDPRWLERRTGLSVEQLRSLNAGHVSLVVASSGEPAPGSLIESADCHEFDGTSVVLETGAEAVRGLLRRRGEPLDPVIERVRVLPVLLRPIIPSRTTSRFWVADLNHIYERLVKRNNVLAEFHAAGAPEYVLAMQREMIMAVLEALVRNRACESPLRDTHDQVLDGLLDLAGGAALAARLREIDVATPERGFEGLMPWDEVVTRRCLQAVGFELVRKGGR